MSRPVHGSPIAWVLSILLLLTWHANPAAAQLDRMGELEKVI